MQRTLCSAPRLLAFALLGCLAWASPSAAQGPSPAGRPSVGRPQGEFVNHVLTDEQGDHKYVVYVPANYTPDREWPVILYLHGASNRGTDGRAQLVSGLAPAIRLQLESYPFLVVFPQCEDTQSRVLGGWTDRPDDGDRALKILDEVEQQYRVDRSRENLVGLSMGGAGVWHLAAKSPDRWAAIVPVSAKANQDLVPNLTSIPTWSFHAAVDPLVSTHSAAAMVDAINAAGGRAHFTEVPTRGHDLSNILFTQPALTAWLLDPSQQPTEIEIWKEPEGYSNGHELEIPFVPGAEISKALRLRICKDVLESLSLAAPEKLATKPLAGQVRGVNQTKRVGMMSVDVALSGLYYRGQVEQVRITPKAPDRLFVQVGLRNLTMTVSNSQINGRVLFNASAGPMHVVIGHQAPVWLTAELRPYVKDRRLYLNLVGHDFRIQPNNWYVTEPAKVRVRGMPLLRGSVSDGLVNGIYERKSEIERQVLAGLPKMIQEVENQLNETAFNKTTFVGQIAMPVWQPRIRSFPEEILIDDDGITLVNGVTLCALGNVPPDFQRRHYAPPRQTPPPGNKGLEVSLSETVIPAWSELIIAGRVHQFNVFDFSPIEYHRLADRDFLQQAIPDLKRFGDNMEANVCFQLRDPIRLLTPEAGTVSKPEDQGLGNPLTLSLSSVPLMVSVRQKGETEWKKVGELDIHVEREYAPRVRKAGFVRRGPQFVEISPFRVESAWTFDSDYTPVNADVDEAILVDGFLKAREASQLLAGVKPESSQDVMLGSVPVRMEHLDWVNEHIVMHYQLPGILVHNDSGKNLAYEVTTPQNRWSERRLLEGGASELLDVPASLTLQGYHDGRPQTYSLKLGSEYRYVVDPAPAMQIVEQAGEHEEPSIVP